MTEKIICMELDESHKTQITLDAFLHKKLEHVNRFLTVVEKHDENIVEKLLENYKNKLVSMNISAKSSNFIQQYNIDYSQHTLLQKHSNYIPQMENAILHFLDFPKYESTYKHGEKIEVLLTDQIRGGMYILFYLAYTLLDLLPRETVLDLAKECTDQLYAIYQDQITKSETLEEMFSNMHGKGCWKTHNIITQVIDGRYYLKVTRCIWADVYAELPDLKLVSLFECHGDFSKMQYINPNFDLSRTKTLVEGDSCCDFVHYDKRKDKEIEHPDEDFWEEFE